MKKKKVVFLGSRPLGVHALHKLREIPSVEIVGCVVKKPSESSWWKEDPFHLVTENVLRHEDLHAVDFDLGVSINYWKIIEPTLIRKPELGFINIHHSYMLSLRGRDMTTNAILEARESNRWYHGTTLHYTDDGLDTGPIIATTSCAITEYDTAWTLFSRVEYLAEDLIDLWLPRLFQARPPIANPEKMQPLHLRSDPSRKHIKNLFSNPILSYDIVRAYDFNGFFEPASTLLEKELVHLTTDAKYGDNLLLELDSNRKIYKTRRWFGRAFETKNTA